MASAVSSPRFCCMRLAIMVLGDSCVIFISRVSMPRILGCEAGRGRDVVKGEAAGRLLGRTRQGLLAPSCDSSPRGVGDRVESSSRALRPRRADDAMELVVVTG